MERGAEGRAATRRNGVRHGLKLFFNIRLFADFIHVYKGSYVRFRAR